MRKTNTPKAPAPAPSDSRNLAEEGVFGSKPSKSPSPDPMQGREPQPAPTAQSSSKMESDTELQAFLDLRDQTDHNTETEVESLMSMNAQRQRDRRGSLRRAEELLQHLRDHSALFPLGGGPQNRYLHVMDCLVSLDSAEDFIRLATEKYPKKREQ
ncbi:unnamed protein product, partial [Lota lota]